MCLCVCFMRFYQMHWRLSTDCGKWQVFVCAKFYKLKSLDTHLSNLVNFSVIAIARIVVSVRCPPVCLSVCPSVCLSHSPAATAFNGFAAVGPADRRYWSIAARPAPQQHGAAEWRTAANAGSATFTADVGSWTQTCSLILLLHLKLLNSLT